MRLTLFFVLLSVIGISAGPIQEVVTDQCARQCTVSNKFNYEIGETYEFKYETEISTAIQGASEDQAGVDLSAKVYIDFLSKCEMVMRLSNVQLTEHDPETSTMKPVISDLIYGLEQNALTVSFQDGSIEKICLSKPENDKILNIKRGILSLIQNNMDDINKDQKVTESDVSGTCETEYTSGDKGWYNKLITKSKNLLGCTGRQGSKTVIQGIPYTSNSHVQSVPLIKSTHLCRQELAKSTGRLQSATCHEEHNFIPFSRSGSGATTHSTQTLTFVKEYKYRSEPGQRSSRTLRVPIQFQHSDGNSAAKTRKDMEQNLMEICHNTKDGVTPDTPKMFSSLVYTMKAMESNDLVAIYQKIKNKEVCSVNNDRVRTFFLDAIPMSGTIDSLKLMVQLLTSGQVTGLDADMWMTSLAFVQNPSIDMLAEAKPLLSMKANQEKAMLSVSSLVHTVCKNNPSCDNFPEVKKITSLLENKIASSCKISDNTFQTSLLALRAIGNAGYGTSAIPTLTKCFKRTDNPIEIRLSAIEAFRGIPCKIDKSMVLSVFIDTVEDSEIRIAAYKALMECPTDYLISRVKGMLGKEEVNQVGSYVWSHLTNLMETSNPHKQTIRSILEDEALQKEFDMDNRKFSRNYEKSLFIEKLNTGAVAEGDVIWSSKSFIPRSVMVNLTVDLFGNAINLFEIGGRVEGLEYFLESYFGPNGYFGENDVKEAVEETAVDVIRSDKMKRIDKRNNRVMDELRGSLYMRVFGNELRYMSFQGLDSLYSQNGFNFPDMMTKLRKENDYQYTHSSIFLDSSMIVPTSSGFPLNLTVTGTATMDFKASGKVDVVKLQTIDVRGIIKPSGSVVVSTIMGIDALDTQAGIKMVSTLHSSTSVQGKVSLSEKSIVNVEFDLPEEKQDIISVSSSFYTIHRHLEREQKMITENRQEYIACTGNRLAKITDLELCGELSFPNASLVEGAPYFPLTGPVKAGLSLYKRDTSMTGYRFEARSIHNADETIFRLAFSTPNSRIDRNFAVDINLNKAQEAFVASFSSPWKKADFKGTFVNENTNKGLNAKMNWDGSVCFDVKINLQSERSGQGMVYTPTVQIYIPGMNQVGLSGTIKYAPWKLFETDISLSGFKFTSVSVKTSIQNKAKLMSASASLQVSPKQVYSAHSSMQTTEFKKKIVYKFQVSIRSPSQELFAFAGTYTNVYGKNIELDMVLDKVVEKPIIFKTKLMTKSYTRGRLQKTFQVDFRSKVLNIKMKSKFDNRHGKSFATDMVLTYVIGKYARDRIKLVNKVIDQSSKSLTKAWASMNLASKRYPVANIKLIGNLNHNKRHSEIETDIAYGPDFKDVNKQVSFFMSMDTAAESLSATLEVKTPLDIIRDVDFQLNHLHKVGKIDSTLKITNNGNSLATIEGKYLNENGKVTSRFSISNPLYDGLSAVLMADYERYPMTGHLEMSISPIKQFTFDGSIDNNPNGDINASMTISFPNRPVIVLLASRQKEGSSVNSVLSLIYEDSKIFRLDSLHLIGIVKQLKLKFTSPFTTKHSAELFFKKSSNNIRANASIEVEPFINRWSVTASLDRSNGISGNLKVNTPHPAISYSQISVLSEMVDGSRQSSVVAEYVPGQFVKLISKYVFKSYEDMDIKIELATPFRVIPYQFVVFRHQGDLSAFSNYVEVLYNGYLSAVDTEFSMTNGIQGSINMKFPSTQDLSGSFRHDGNIHKFASHCELTWGKTVSADIKHKGSLKRFSSSAKVSFDSFSYSGNINFNLGPTMVTDIVIDTPISNFKNVRLSHAFECKVTTFTNHVEFSTSRLGTVSTDVSVDFTNAILTVSAQTPFNNFRDMKAVFKHEGSLSRFSTHAEFQNGLSKYSGHMKLNTDPAVSFETIFETPSKNFNVSRLALTAEGITGNFRLHIETQLNKDISEVDLICNTLKKYEIDLTIRSPYTATIKASLDHLGNWKKFHSKVNLRSGKGKLLSSIKFAIKTTFNAMISIKSPIIYLKNQRLSLKHAGSLNSFKCDLQYKCNGKTYIGEASFQNRNTLKAELSLKVPIFRPISVTFSHHGTRSYFKSAAVLSIGKKTIQANVNLNTVKGIKGSIDLVTPFEGFESMNVAISHEGELNKFRSRGEIKYNRKSGQVDVTVDATRGLSTTILIATPFKGYRDITCSLKHTGTIDNFNTLATYSQASKSIEGQVTFQRSPVLSGSASLKSSFASFCELSVNFGTNRDYSILVSSADISFDSKTIFNMRSTLENAYRKAVIINVIISDNSVNFVSTIDGIITDFNGHLEANVNSMKTEADVSFSLKPVSVSLSLKLPFIGTVSSAFYLVGNIANFKGHGELSINNCKNEGDISFGLSPLRFDITIKLPVQDVIISFVHEGNLRNFRTNADISIDNKKIDTQLIFNIETAIEGSAGLNIPNMKPLKASFGHTSTRRNLRNLISMEYGEVTLASSDFSLSYNPLQAAVSIKTPFDGYKIMSAVLSHNAGPLDFNTHAEIIIQGQKSQGDITFKFDSKLEGRISASSPFFPLLGLGFQFSGNSTKFSTDVDFSVGDNKFYADAVVVNKAGIEASGTVYAQIHSYENISAKITHTDHCRRMSSFLQVKIGHRNLLTGIAQVNDTDGISGKLSLQSVLTPTIQVNVEHTGRFSEFKTNAELRINGQPASATVGFTTTPSVSAGILSLTSPFAKPVSGSFKLKSVKKEMSLHIEGILDNRSLVGDASIEYGNTIGANAAVKTPFTGFEDMKGSIKYIKGYKGFTGYAFAEFSGRKIEAEVKSSWRQAVTGTLSITTPYETFRHSSAEFTFDGTFPNVQTEISVLHSGQKYRFSGSIDNAIVRFMINTPFPGFEVMGASFNYEGTKESMQTEAMVNYMTGMEIFVSFLNVHTIDRHQTKAKIKTPFTKDIFVDLIFSGQLTDFSNTLTITMDEAYSITSKTSLELLGTSLNFDTSLHVTFPGYSDEQKLSVSYAGLLPNIKASTNAKFLENYFSFDTFFQVDDSINGMIALRTPFAILRDVAFNFDHTGSSRRFTTRSEIQYDTTKKIEGTLQYVQYGWRIFQMSLDIRTPFPGFETSNVAYRHTASVDSLESDAEVSFMNKDLSGNMHAYMTPLSVSIFVETPFPGFEEIRADSKLTFGSGTFSTEASVHYMQDKAITLSSSADMTSTPKSVNIKLATPFQGLEKYEMILSTSGDLSDFQSTMVVFSPFTSVMRVRGNMKFISLINMEGIITLSSEIKNFENVRLNLKNEVNHGKYQSKIQLYLAPSKSVTFDGSFKANRYLLSANMTLSTPFQAMKQLDLKLQNLFGIYSGKLIAAMDLRANSANRKLLSSHMTLPTILTVELEETREGKYELALTVSNEISNVNNGVTIHGVFNPKTNDLSIKYTCPLNTISLNGTFGKSNTKFDIVVNDIRYSYDMTITGTHGQIKVVLPSRSLKVSGSQSAGTTEGSFMWDADKDETRKIGFRSDLRPIRDSVKSDITLMMPSIGKEVQIDSQMSLNKGRIIFDGKTELTYSRDRRKKLTIMTRLEDISNSYTTRNYSFIFDISHPYTGVDVQVASQFGTSNHKVTGGLNMNYVTVERDVKTFSMNGEIDKVRGAFFIDMETPVKKIEINGIAQTVSPYRLSLTNTYDAKRPLNAVFSFDPSKRRIDFRLNYDLDNPSSEFHLSAKNLHNSALIAEMFHVVNRQRVTDVLLGLRLNTPSLLHSRFHWRPAMIYDLRALCERKVNIYQRRRMFAYAALDSMNSELKQKAELIGNSFTEEVESVTAIAEENLRKLSEMHETNEYYIRDITDAVLLRLAQMEELSEAYINLFREQVEERLTKCKEKLRGVLHDIEFYIAYFVLGTADFNWDFSDRAHGISKPVIQTPIEVSPVSNLADAYTSAIYGGLGVIRSRLSTLMDNVDVRYVMPVSDRLYQQGYNAYKYWEIRENTEMVGKAVADWIREKLGKEIADAKATLMNLQKSEVTVDDMKSDENQIELHPQMPHKSLNSIPMVEFLPYVNKAKSYIQKIASLSWPSNDVTTWLPPFDAMATIEGNKITTFDGLTYDIDNSCTFMLARDYVDSNFSVVLNRDGNNKTMVIVKGQTSIQIFSNGKVTVNNMPVELPAIVNDVTITTSLDGRAAINVAGHLNVDYYKDLDTYMVKLNGYYYGKTNGLLGSYDNEPSNDMMTSFGKDTVSVDRFAKSWDVGAERCR